MNVLLKSVTIMDPTSKHHLKKRDVLIENGVFTKIASSINPTKKVKEISLPNLHISQAWFDSSVSFGEPGFEERETIANGSKVAIKSGFAHIAINTNTNPVADTKAGIQFIIAKARDQNLQIYPIGALTVKSEGNSLAELYDMQNEGAISFYDYKKPITNPNLLKIALQYSQTFDGLVQSFPLEKNIATNGMVNEEVNSTRLGLKGIPALSEELQIIRDLYILEYTGGKLHIPTISTKKSVALIKEAKKKGLDVSCSVSINNLILTDDVLESFDTNYKLLPPLRTQNDVKALIKGIVNGTIDGVTSDHNPIDVEHKKTEFEHAYYGSIGLESCFGALNKIISTEKTVSLLTQLKERFNIPKHSIKEGETVDLTLFNPKKEWVFKKENIQSTSKNTALLGQELQGFAYGIYSNKKLVLPK